MKVIVMVLALLATFSISRALVSLASSIRRTASRASSALWMVVSEKPLSQRVKEAAITKFSPQGDVSRIVGQTARECECEIVRDDVRPVWHPVAGCETEVVVPCAHPREAGEEGLRSM